MGMTTIYYCNALYDVNRKIMSLLIIYHNANVKDKKSDSKNNLEQSGSAL